MKRLSSVFSSESDSEEFDIAKIKKKYKKSKNESNKELPSDSVKVDKKKKLLPNKNQMTLESAFSKVAPVKHAPVNTLEQYFKKADVKPPIKEEISASDFFSAPKKRPTGHASVDRPSPPRQPKQEPSASTSAMSSPPPKFVVERSPLKDIKPKVGDSFSTPVKSSPAPAAADTESTPQSAKRSYHAYLNRSGPSALGSKPIPEGAPNCLAGMTFVLTGVLDSIERDDAQALIHRHGGKVTKALSGKTTYLIVGSDAGASKIDKAEKLKTKQINEDELFDLIRTPQLHQTQTSSKAPPKKDPATSRASGSGKKRLEKLVVIKEDKSDVRVVHEDPPKKTKLAEDKPLATSTATKAITPTVPAATTSTQKQSLSGKPIIPKYEKQLPVDTNTAVARPNGPVLLVDKYRPTTMKQIVGQQGDRSCAHKLHHWLKNWHTNLSLGFNKSDEGDHFRGALLSGSPGIGKTTTAHVVCRDLGFHIREYNASSARSKKHMAEVRALSQESNAKSWSADLRYCIIMDEIDGMAGNEDRGGIAELMSIVKTSRVPIICICNDRQSRKLQTIGKYLYDLRFRQLTLEQIKATMKSVAFKEKIAIPDAPLNDIIMASNFDLRQVFNNMQLWAATTMESEALSTDAKRGHKEFKIGPFDIVKRVFSHEQAHTFTEKLELFFEDYQLGGLMVQENYLAVAPHKARTGGMAKTLELMSLAADSIATSDVVSRKLHTTNNWGLLPLQGMFASVLPGEYMHGRLTARIAFPSWLGKYSKQNKNYRILSNLSLHLKNSTRGGVSNGTILAMDYGQPLMRRIVRPLREGDVEVTLNILNQMQLLREDVDLLAEAIAWSHREDPLAGVSSQIKSTLTRSYNKASFKVPYSIVAVKKGRTVVDAPLTEGEAGETELTTLGEDQDDEETEEKDDGVDGDCMIVKKQTKSKTAAGTAIKSTSKSSSSKPKKTTSSPAKPRKPSTKKSKP